jgi:integrase
MLNQRPRLTNKLIDDTTVQYRGVDESLRKEVILWDGGPNPLRGFGCRISPKGKRSFFLQYRMRGGRQGYITIGDRSAWTVGQARERAKELKREVNNGIDPAAERRERREAATVRDLCQRYIDDHMPTMRLRNDSRRRDELTKVRLVEEHLKPRTLAEDVHGGDVTDMVRRITKERGPVRANHVLGVCRKMFNLALVPAAGETKPWVENNPCRGVKPNRVEGRRDKFSPAQLAAIRDALDDLERTLATELIRLVLLTGCRPGEATLATWAEFDEPGVWVRPGENVKTKATLEIPLGRPAQALIERLRAERDPDRQRVFVPSRAGEVLDYRGTWEKVRQPASVLLWGDSDDPRVAGLVAAIRAAAGREPKAAEVQALAAAQGLTLPPALIVAPAVWRPPHFWEHDQRPRLQHSDCWRRARPPPDRDLAPLFAPLVGPIARGHRQGLHRDRQRRPGRGWGRERGAHAATLKPSGFQGIAGLA